MKFLVFARPNVSVPDDKALALWRATKEWTNARLTDGTLDCAYNLPTGGGVGIINSNSHEALTEILSSYPLQPWVQYEIHVLSDVNHLFDLAIMAAGG